MTTGELAGIGSFILIIIGRMLDFTMKLYDKMASPKLTQADVEQMKWQTNLLGIQDEMRKSLQRLNDKGDDREKILDDIHGIAERDHRHLGEIKSHVNTLSTSLATGVFCNAKGDK